MVDDILTVSKCGLQALEMNARLNAKIESKKLRLSKDKCFQIHICKNESTCSTKLKVHESNMKRTNIACYLSDYISESGSNDDTIKARELKAIGIVSQLTSILKNVTLGIFYFQTAFILRDAMLINGILTN